MLEVGYCNSRVSVCELKPDERIIGFKSRKHEKVKGVHCDF